MPLKPQGRIFNDITETIGGTPLALQPLGSPPGTFFQFDSFFGTIQQPGDRIEGR